MKTLQEIFNAAVSGLLVQGRPSRVDSDSSNGCMYHAPNGDRCAVGQLIPREIDTVEIEGNGAQNELVLNLLHDCGVPLLHCSETVELLCALQGVHDSKDAPDWFAAFAQVAKKYNLSPLIISEFTATLPFGTTSVASGDSNAPAKLIRRSEDVILQIN